MGTPGLDIQPAGRSLPTGRKDIMRSFLLFSPLFLVGAIQGDKDIDDGHGGLCCYEKKVGGIQYFHAGNGDSDKYESLGCNNHCLYKTKDSDKKYCFAPGDLKVECDGQGGPDGTGKPTGKPSGKPTGKPTGKPSGKPPMTDKPTGKPSDKPTGKPTDKPTDKPSDKPDKPSGKPTGKPSDKPTGTPTGKPSGTPTGKPTG